MDYCDLRGNLTSNFHSWICFQFLKGTWCHAFATSRFTMGRWYRSIQNASFWCKKTLKTHRMFSQILTVCKEFRILSDEISVGHYGFQLICTEAELPVSLWRTIGINWLWWTFASSLSSNKLWHYQFDWLMVASQSTRISFASDILQVVYRAKFVVQWKVVR